MNSGYAFLLPGISVYANKITRPATKLVIVAFPLGTLSKKHHFAHVRKMIGHFVTIAGAGCFCALDDGLKVAPLIAEDLCEVGQRLGREEMELATA